MDFLSVEIVLVLWQSFFIEATFLTTALIRFPRIVLRVKMVLEQKMLLSLLLFLSANCGLITPAKVKDRFKLPFDNHPFYAAYPSVITVSVTTIKINLNVCLERISLVSMSLLVGFPSQRYLVLSRVSSEWLTLLIN